MEQQGMSIVRALLLLVLGGLLLAVIVTTVGDRRTPPTAEEAAEAARRRSAEAIRRDSLDRAAQEARREARAAAEAAQTEEQALVARIGPRPVVDTWDGGILEVERALKATAHDPRSIDVEGCTEPVPTDEGWLAACTYFGKNAFGARVRNRGVFVIRHGTARMVAE